MRFTIFQESRKGQRKVNQDRIAYTYRGMKIVPNWGGSMSQRFFATGELRADAFRAAETDALALIESIAGEFAPDQWHEAFASSGTALALAAILEENGLSSGGITPEGLARLRKRMEN